MTIEKKEKKKRVDTPSINFKYRRKEWKLAKEAYGFSLQAKTGEGVYNIIGYYSDTRAIIDRLVKEHFITDTDGKELKNTITKTCKELGDVINKALK